MCCLCGDTLEYKIPDNLKESKHFDRFRYAESSKHRIARGGVADLGMHLCEFLFMKEMRRLNMDLFDGLLISNYDL